MKPHIFTFGTNPALAFEQGGILEGFQESGWPEGCARRIRALAKCLGVAPDDQEYQLLINKQGLLALVGFSIPGYEFAVERPAPR